MPTLKVDIGLQNGMNAGTEVDVGGGSSRSGWCGVSDGTGSRPVRVADIRYPGQVMPTEHYPTVGEGRSYSYPDRRNTSGARHGPLSGGEGW